MNKYSVEPKSRKELRMLAKQIRKNLGLEDQLYFPVVELLERLPDIYIGLECQIVEDIELPINVHATTDITSKIIKIKRSVYDSACEGNGRDRMTIMHEISHYITLCELNFTLARSFEEEKVPTYCDPEWQAKCLAGELMMPAEKIKNMNPEKVMKECGVSWDAANYQLSKI